MRRLNLGFMLVMASILTVGAARGAMSCMPPSMEALLASYAKQHLEEDYYPAATSSGPVMAEADGKTVQWYGIQWESPPGGLLYVLSCDGKVLALKRIGAVLSINAGPRLPGVGDTVVVDYIEGSGTGAQIQSSSVLSLQGTHLRELWTHDLNSYQFMLPGEHWKTNYTIGFSNKGRLVEAIGIKEIYHPDTAYDAKPDDVKHVRDIACWNAKQSRYLGCTISEHELKSLRWNPP